MMNGIDTIIQRLNIDAKAETDALLEKARQEAAAVAARYQAQADKEAADLAARNERLAAEREERLISAAQMEALNMDPSYADRYLNVGFSGGEKKKAEILQLLMLKPALALLDETDSGLDVDAVKTVASGIKAYHNADNALIIITHNAKILEGLQVDYVHVLDDARIVRTGDGSLVNEIIEEGFTALKEDEAK